jgi:signal transduction histidine kinase
MSQPAEELSALAEYLNSRREAILLRWRAAVKKDPSLSTGDSLPQADLYDHIPALLANFTRDLAPQANPSIVASIGQANAAAHGLQRWQQGYDLREVTRELGKLNECVVAELEIYATETGASSRDALVHARKVWAALCSTGIEESVGQYFQLQQQEAAGHLRDLEAALNETRSLDQRRGEMWRQAAHDLRGNLGVVANATVGLTHPGMRDSNRDDIVRILLRNVTSLHHLLEDVTSLARLQSGSEARRIEPMDVGQIMNQLCDGIRPMAQQRHLFLRCEGPQAFTADGDAIKLRRIAQNLVFNAVKYTHEGGITLKWGDSNVNDPKRWELCIIDTGPGFHSNSGKPLADALEKDCAPGNAREPLQSQVPLGTEQSYVLSTLEEVGTARSEAGEGIGLSIVKRLCDMLDATIELTSTPNVGTTFRILFPRSYPH